MTATVIAPADRPVHRPHRALGEPGDQRRQHRPGAPVVRARRDHPADLADAQPGVRPRPRSRRSSRWSLLAIPPILVDAYAGLRAVDRDLVEAARGMGFRERQILADLEVPLATPVIVGGFRTATLQVIATATIGAIVVGWRARSVHRRRHPQPGLARPALRRRDPRRRIGHRRGPHLRPRPAPDHRRRGLRGDMSDRREDIAVADGRRGRHLTRRSAPS